jgi:uncharacterized SAM-binding protein YcdF (DUF218 family)
MVRFPQISDDGMSDEPKKRSRAWIWWMLLALFALYPLSVGPATRLVTSPESDETASAIYAPIFWLASQSVWAGSALEWYLSFWVH